MSEELHDDIIHKGTFTYYSYVDGWRAFRGHVVTIQEDYSKGFCMGLLVFCRSYDKSYIRHFWSNCMHVYGPVVVSKLIEDVCAGNEVLYNSVELLGTTTDNHINPYLTYEAKNLKYVLKDLEMSAETALSTHMYSCWDDNYNMLGDQMRYQH